jgi:hypothetical protein
MNPAEHSDAVAMLNARAKARGWPLRCDAALKFERKELVALCAVWQDKGKDGIPPRSAFDMRVLKPFLRHLSIVESIPGGKGARFRFRYFGTAMVTVFGERTGQFLDDVVPPESLENWSASYEAALAQGGPLRMLSSYKLPGIDHLSAESIFAPMLDDKGAMSFILSATYVGPKARLSASHAA